MTHDVAHAIAGHTLGLNGQDVQTVAELTAFVVLTLYGIDGPGYSFPYVSRYARDTASRPKWQLCGLMLTLIANTPPTLLTAAAPSGWTLRPCCSSDIPALGRLYFESYDPGVACPDLAEAVADIQSAFAGAYGELWRETSLVAVAQGGQLTAAIQVVRRAPWEDTPDCPFVIELFTDRMHRRRGLARALVRQSMVVLTGANQERLALRVDEGNAPALNLYRSLGFRESTAESDRPSPLQ